MAAAIAMKPDILSAAQELSPLIEASRDESERERTLPASLVAAIVDARLHHMHLPRALGGLEADPITFLRVIEDFARLDGAVGWNVTIWGSSGLFVARLPEQAAREISRDPTAILSGALAPNGKAIPVDGGYRVSGRWPLASGCLHASWLAGGSMIIDGERPRMRADGTPDIRIMFVPRVETEIIDTWHSAGLRGTGSHDFAVHDVFVPEEYTWSFPDGPSFDPSPLYRGSIFDQLGLGLAAVSLGIARAALDTFADLAGRKIPSRTTTLLRERGTVQAQVAQAEALVRSARALVFETATSTWETLCAGHPISEEQRMLRGLAAVNAASSCAQAVDIVYTLGGATSVYTSSRLERCFRDVHVVTQHRAVSPIRWEWSGQYFLGLGLGGR